MMGKVMNGLSKMANPATYTNAFATFQANLHTSLRAGSIKPLFYTVGIIGTVGYSMEWYAKGRHHAAHRRAILEKAAKEGHH